jgi:hypothetical protein
MTRFWISDGSCPLSIIWLPSSTPRPSAKPWQRSVEEGLEM